MKPFLTLLLLVLLVLTISPLWAVESGLANVRLDQNVLELLAKFGEPGFIGPVGAVVGKPAGQPFNAPAGPGASVMAAPEAAPIGRFSFLGRNEDAAPPPPPVSTPGAPVGAVSQAAGGVHYWLWDRGSAKLALALTPTGNVTTIMIAGSILPGVKTELGVGLADVYDTIVRKYGFPEGTENRGSYLILRYVSAGLTFTLQNLRVIGICLEAAPGPVSGMVTPAEGPALAGPAGGPAPGALGIFTFGRR